MREHTYQTEESQLLSFDPITVVRDVVRRWYVVVAVALIAAMASYVVTDMGYEPRYTTTTTFVATVRGSSTTVYQNLSAATNLASVFSEVLNSSILRAAILEELDMAYFDGSISAAVMPETNLLTLRVSAPDPRTAFLVTRSIIDNHHIVSYQVLGDTVLEVLQDPVVPSAPSNANLAPSHAKRMGMLAGAAMCVVLALLSYLRDAVRSRQELEQKLDCRCLGVVHHERKYKTLGTLLRRKKTSILITKPNTSFHFVESIRKLRRQVEQRLEKGKGCLLVTSVLENEGKSTVAVNLALSLAQKHRKVLLVDCDVRKSACYKLLGMQERSFTGTVAVLRGAAEPEEAIFFHEATGLHLLLERNTLHSSTDLVGSEAMDRLLRYCREHYDYIIVDLPPMSASPDTESVMELADASLLVVQQNAASTPRLQSAVDALEGARAKLLGCVLNNVYSSPLSHRGGYGYGYSYGYGYGRYGKYGKYGKYGGYGAGKTQQ